MLTLLFPFLMLATPPADSLPQARWLTEARTATTLSPERQQTLDQLARHILRLRQERGEARVLFVCTHNSRRSQLSEVLLLAAAQYHKVPGISTASAGTETTAFNERAVAALNRAGFSVKPAGTKRENGGPVYQLELPGLPPQQMYSKIIADAVADGKPFVAVMVCSEADAACPAVPGAFARIALPFVDPKAADGTPAEAQTYDLRTRQIAGELMYVIERVAAGM